MDQEVTTAPVAEKPRAPRPRKPFNRAPKEFAIATRPGTKKALLIDLLSRPEGATFEECREATGWQGYKQLYESIHVLNAVLGYGLTEGEDGRIRLVTPQAGVRPFQGGQAS